MGKKKIAFSDLGERLRGYEYRDSGVSDDNAFLQLELSRDDRYDRWHTYMLAAILERLKTQHDDMVSLGLAIDRLPRASEIAAAIAKGEERICKAREKAAKAELEAKQANPTVVVIQCPNEVIDRIPVRRLRGRW